MGLVILPALIPDIEKTYDTYFEAFKGDLILDVLFPWGVTPEFRTGHTAHTLSYWHKSPVQYTIKCIDTTTNEIIGMALWDVYLSERPESEWKRGEVDWLEGEQKARAEKLLFPLWDAKARVWEGRPHVYCHVVAVNPEHRKRGAGRLLTRWGLDVGEAAGLPVYLESSVAGYKLYKDLDFQELPEKVVHKPEVTGEKDDIEVPLMVKFPKAARGLSWEDWVKGGHDYNVFK